MRQRIQNLKGHPMAGRVTRYSLGSGVALLTSVVTFALLDAAGMHTTLCSIIAFLAGVIPNWILNRRWAWEVQGRVSILREVVGYVAIALIALVASALATSYTQGHVGQLTTVHWMQVAIVTSAYVAVQAVLFVAKFVAYDRWVFAGRSRVRAALRSRMAVWSTARANRIP